MCICIFTLLPLSFVYSFELIYLCISISVCVQNNTSKVLLEVSYQPRDSGLCVYLDKHLVTNPLTCSPLWTVLSDACNDPQAIIEVEQMIESILKRPRERRGEVLLCSMYSTHLLRDLLYMV